MLIFLAFWAKQTEENKRSQVSYQGDHRKNRRCFQCIFARYVEWSNILDAIFVCHLVPDCHCNDTAQDASEGDEVVDESESGEPFLAANEEEASKHCAYFEKAEGEPNLSAVADLVVAI